MNDLIRRLNNACSRRYRWWDWGHRVMILTGRDLDGHEIPRVRDMWWRQEDDGRIITTRDAAEVRARNDGEWRVFDSQNDGHEIVIGWWPGPGGNGRIQRAGLDSRAEQALFMRWFIWDGWVKAEWFGIRRWLYLKALTASVNGKIPFTCQATPGKFSGGYSHWHCQLKRKHQGPHRFRNATWTDADAKVEFNPAGGVR